MPRNVERVLIHCTLPVSQQNSLLQTADTRSPVSVVQKQNSLHLATFNIIVLCNFNLIHSPTTNATWAGNSATALKVYM
jgi:hypothetical protein